MELPFRIEKKNSFRVAGYKIQTTNKNGEGRKSIPALWTEFKANSLDKPLLALSSQKSLGLFGINIYNTDIEDSRKFEYLLAVTSDCEVPKQFSVYNVPAMTWAVFPCTLDTIGKTEAMAITKWLPKSQYRPLNKGYLTGRMKSGAPDIEHYGENGVVEVWIAVDEK